MVDAASARHLTTADSPAPKESGAAKRARLSIGALLGLAFGGLVLLGVGGALAIGLGGARTSLANLLRDRIEITIDHVVSDIDGHLQPVQVQAAFLAKRIALDPGLLARPEELTQFARGTMAATPQVDAIGIVKPDMTAIRVTRAGVGYETGDYSSLTTLVAAMERVTRTGQSSWSDPILSQVIGVPLISYRMPVIVEDRVVAAIFIVVTIEEISQFTRDVSSLEHWTAFVLYGEDRILAHPLREAFAYQPTAEAPLPPLAVNYDPVLADIWSPKRRPLTAVAALSLAQGHWVEFEDDYRVFAYRRIHAYGDTPWIVGIYAPGKVIGGEVRRFWSMVVAGGVLLLVSLFAAAFAGRRLAKPILDLAEGARRMNRLEDLHAVRPLPASRVREFDEAARAFNAMVGVVRRFATYVPRALTERLVRTGRDLPTRERRLSVMFTDIQGFSTLAEKESAANVAALLNEHFRLVGEAIEETGGTIDKYIGDSVMAFWGAPDRQNDHARRAYTAARLIVEKIGAWNETRAKDGLPRVRMRVGLHCGRVVVGNIGFEGRINYTVIGDAVNVAQRIEQAAKAVEDDADVVVLASAEMLSRLDKDVPSSPLGIASLRGREGQVGIVRLF